jgi:hypothetical protein
VIPHETRGHTIAYANHINKLSNEMQPITSSVRL